MADQVSARIMASFTGTLRNAVGTGIATTSFPAAFNYALAIADGTSLNQADKLWFSTGRTLSQNANETLDVYDFASLDIGAGSGEDPLGGALALAEIMALMVINRSTSAGKILVGGDGTTAAWNSIFNADDDAVLGPLGPGGMALICDPNAVSFAVADSTNHLLKVTENNTGAVTYDIAILGRSA